MNLQRLERSKRQHGGCDRSAEEFQLVFCHMQAKGGGEGVGQQNNKL